MKRTIINALVERNNRMNYGFSKTHITKKVKEYKNDYYSNYNNFANWIFEDQDYEDRIDQVLDFCR